MKYGAYLIATLFCVMLLLMGIFGPPVTTTDKYTSPDGKTFYVEYDGNARVVGYSTYRDAEVGSENYGMNGISIVLGIVGLIFILLFFIAAIGEERTKRKGE